MSGFISFFAVYFSLAITVGVNIASKFAILNVAYVAAVT